MTGTSDRCLVTFGMRRLVEIVRGVIPLKCGRRYGKKTFNGYLRMTR